MNEDMKFFIRFINSNFKWIFRKRCYLHGKSSYFCVTAKAETFIMILYTVCYKLNKTNKHMIPNGKSKLHRLVSYLEELVPLRPQPREDEEAECCFSKNLMIPLNLTPGQKSNLGWPEKMCIPFHCRIEKKPSRFFFLLASFLSHTIHLSKAHCTHPKVSSSSRTMIQKRQKKRKKGEKIMTRQMRK